MAPSTNEFDAPALHNFEYCRNKRSDYSYAEQQCEIRCRIFIRNLIMQLLSGQIKRHPEISTGVHNTLQLKLHQFQHKLKEILTT